MECLASFRKYFTFAGIFCSLMTIPDLTLSTALSIESVHLTKKQRTVLGAAKRLLETYEISYVYGGQRIGDTEECYSCNQCLAEKKPRPTERQIHCPVCTSCSLDCSHFVNLVFKEAGMPLPYLTSLDMSNLSPTALKKKFHLIDLGRNPSKVRPGDLLVYRGHVVMLEALTPSEILKLNAGSKASGPLTLRGDILHATGGQAIRMPGAAIQRERFIDLSNFRGQLLRILRHEELQ